jgi:PAS domain S-box-containing protein
MHRLLERQLRRHVGEISLQDNQLSSFLEIIDNYYHEIDKEKRLINNALAVSAAELNEVNERLRIQNAEMTRILLNTLSDAVYATDLAGKITFLNSSAEKILKARESELIGKHMHEIMQFHQLKEKSFYPEDSPHNIVLKMNEPIEGSSYISVSTKEFIPINFKSQPILSNKKLVGALVSIQDVTEKKKNELLIQQTQERLNLSLEGSNLAIWDWNIASDDLFMSDRWYLMLGGEKQVLLTNSQSFFDIVHVEDRERVYANLMSALKNINEFYSVNFRVKQINGDYIWVHSYGKVMERNPNGLALRMAGTIFDISDNIKAEEQLKKSEAKLRTLYESTSDAVILLDNNLFVDCNIATLSMFGCSSKEEFCSRSPSFYSSPIQSNGKKSSDYIKDLIAEALDKGLARFEWLYQRADNKLIFNTEVLLNTIELEGKNIFQITVRDITERKKAEELLEQAKNAAIQSEKMKRDFLANMSHEIRTPLNGIIGMTDLIIDTPLSHEQQEYISLIKMSSDDLLTVVNDILDFSKIESGKMNIEVIEFSLDDMLRNTMRTLALKAHKKNLELLLQVDPDVPDRLMGDPSRLRQIITNLISNAIKFTESGEIELAVKKSDAANTVNTQLSFSVRDTGIGIPKDKFDLIFESFSQADTSTNRKFGGTGLGLAISSQLVSLMGGTRIHLESQLNKGSTFSFSLPFDTATNDPLKNYRLTMRTAGVPILVVEDNLSNGKLLKGILENWKMLPTVVESAEQALLSLEAAKTSGKPFTLVLIDIHLPNMNGLQLAKKIIGFNDYHCATIMMSTADNQHELARRCMDLGVTGFLLKPISQSELLNAIMVALGEPEKQTSIVSKLHFKKTSNKLNLLLAEDNLVNQKLAIRLLEKLGHQVTLANNGLEALTHLKKAKFDAILMDVDMPVLNGYETTLKIRENEKISGGHIPILAMTAHAMEGAREKCILHGMDGYISKPISADALWRELELIGNLRNASKEVSVNLSELKIADFDKALEVMNNSAELFAEISETFLIEAPIHMKKIKDSLAQDDIESLRFNAHTLKGMVSIFHAEKTLHAVSKIENMLSQNQKIHSVDELENSLKELLHTIQNKRLENKLH